MGDVEAGDVGATGQQVGGHAPGAAAVVEQMMASHVVQCVQAIAFSLAENSRLIDADDQRVVVAGEVLGLVPFSFKM
jgi:hypothetical protein